MTFGCCVNLLPRREGPAGSGYAREIKEVGYDYIELPLHEVAQIDSRELEELADLLKELDLPCRGCNAFLPPSIQIVGRDVTSPEEVDRYLVRAFQRMERLGASIAGLGSPKSRTCPEDFPPERGLEQLIRFLRRAGQIAQDYGVVVALEHNNRSETNLINRYREGLAVIRAVDRPNVNMLCDYFHLRWEGESPQVLLEGGLELLAHTHIARLQGRGYFTSLEGELPMVQDYAEVLRALGYTGGVSVEAQTEGRETWRREAEESLKQLRRVFCS